MIAVTIVAVATPEVSLAMLLMIAGIVVVAMLIVIAFDRAILNHFSVKPSETSHGLQETSKTK